MVKAIEEGIQDTRKRFGNKYVWVNFVLSLLIVTAHIYSSDFINLNNQTSLDADIAKCFLYLFKNYLSQLGVPMFFAMSGFMFFRNFTWDKLILKWKSRFFTLVIPYLLWNALSFVFYFTISNISFTKRFLSMERVTITFKTVFEGIFLHYYSFYMWFVKVLIIFVLLTPIIYASLKNRIISTIGCIGLCLFGILYNHTSLNTGIYTICFYYIGAYAGTYLEKTVVEGVGRRRSIISLILFIVSTLLCMALRHICPGEIIYIWKIISVCLLWFALDAIKEFGKPIRIARMSFFIYCTHEIFIRFLDKVVYHFFPLIPGGITLGIATTAVGSMVLSCCMGLIMQKIWPKGYSVLVGGRKIDG